jgi:Secretion system C-terminal sorting domain
MKKSLLIVSALLIAAMSSTAQITITTADVATPVKIIYQANDTVPTGFSVGGFGTNQTWNMTSLQTSFVDTLTFMSASWLPNVNFPSSDLIMKQGWRESYVYMSNTASGLTTQGFAGMVDLAGYFDTVTVINTPSEILMNFPGNFGTTFTNNFSTVTPAFYYGQDPFSFGYPIDYIRMNAEVRKSVIVDAWGSLTTPLGTFNVIRAEETIVRYDTIDIYLLGAGNDAIVTQADSTTGYTWWANGVGFPLVSIKLDSLGNMKQVQWLQANPVAGVNEYEATVQVNAYPNPAQNEITFSVEATKASIVEIYDIAGRVVGSYQVRSNNTKVDISDYPNGSYTFALLGKEDAIGNRGKFSVVK